MYDQNLIPLVDRSDFFSRFLSFDFCLLNIELDLV